GPGGPDAPGPVGALRLPGAARRGLLLAADLVPQGATTLGARRDLRRIPRGLRRPGGRRHSRVADPELAALGAAVRSARLCHAHPELVAGLEDGADAHAAARRSRDGERVGRRRRGVGREIRPGGPDPAPRRVVDVAALADPRPDLRLLPAQGRRALSRVRLETGP